MRQPNINNTQILRPRLLAHNADHRMSAMPAAARGTSHVSHAAIAPSGISRGISARCGKF